MRKSNDIKISDAASEKYLDHVRNLIKAFLKWHLKRHLEDIDLINEYFDPKYFEEELASLPGKYSMPSGKLLLAFYNDQPAGCVALKKIDDHSCEMKRMFVYPEFHGKGIGYALAKAIIDEAKKIGYLYMKLDTSIRQIEAQKLYQGFGFKNIEVYYELPDKQKNWLVFMELRL
jgi:GNAT superfamily N-acetyltransferase